MARPRRILFALCLLLALVGAQSLATGATSTSSHCTVPNAAGPAVTPGQAAAPQKSHKKRKRQKHKPVKLSLQADPLSANRVVNLGDDREPEEVTLRVNASPQIPPNYEKRLEVVAEPFTNSSETAETVSFSEPRFSPLRVSGNRKRITFTMCIDPPNDLPAGKYATTVMVEGPPPTAAAAMTITINGKDGYGFIAAAVLTAILAFLVLLYKGAGEKRALLIAEAEKKPEGERKAEVEKAERWWKPIKGCLRDLGWLVPTLASVAAAFALLYAAYANNPAWGEGGIVTSAIALIGTGLAAVGAKAVFTQSATTR
jgi:hypothetical protein